MLLEKALEMPPVARVAFAELIHASIDYEADEIRQEWIAEVKKENVEKLVIKKATMDEQKPFVEIVDQILSAKRSGPSIDTGELEAKIDRMVYKLYDLTPEEIKIVEG